MSGEGDIQDIKKEIIQSHNLIIKTDNLIKNLSGEIRQIQKKQESYERKYWINSIGAYVVIAAVCFAGIYIGFEAKVDAVRREKDMALEQLAKVRGEADELQSKLSVRAQQEKAAENLLRLKREKRDDDALKAAEELDVNRLSPVLGRMVSRETEELRQSIGQQALDAGKSLFGKGYLKRAQREFDRSIGVHPPATILAEAHYQRAQLMLKLSKSAKAAEDFLKAVEATPQASFADYALYQAAGSLESSGDVPRALQAYKRLVSEFPNCRWVSAAKRRIDRLSQDKDAALPAKPTAAPKPKPPDTKPEPTATPAAPAVDAGQ